MANKDVVKSYMNISIKSTILLILLPLLSFGQESTSKFSFGFVYSPTLSYKTIDNKIASVDTIINTNSISYENVYSPKLCFSTGGIIVQFEVKSRFLFESGISLVNRGESKKMNTFGIIPIFNPEDSSNIYKSTESKISLLYLDIPFSISFFIVETPRFGSDLVFGISGCYLLSSWTSGKGVFLDGSSLSYKDPIEISHYSFRDRINLSFELGLRAWVLITDNIRIRLFISPANAVIISTVFPVLRAAPNVSIK